MIDTQETNLPKGEILPDENGELKKETPASAAEPTEAMPTTDVTTGTEAPSEEIIPADETPETADVQEEVDAEATEPTETLAEDSEIVPEAEIAPEPVIVSEVEIAPEMELVSETEIISEPEETLLSEQGSEPEESQTSELPASLTKAEIIERLQQVVAAIGNYPKGEADALKQAYYNIRHAETAERQQKILEQGGDAKDFPIPADEYEPQLKALMSEYRNKRAAIVAEEERLKEANYLLKQSILERMKELTEAQGNFNESFIEFRELQRKWQELKLVPQAQARELGRSYQLYNDRFYQIVRIHNQLRNYDHKKNLDKKIALCEAAELLIENPDPIAAYNQYQELYLQWRETGQVSGKMREIIWERFRAASLKINKNYYRSHSKVSKEQSEANYQEKAALCEIVESIDFAAIETMKEWDKKMKEVNELKSKWQEIGHSSRSQDDEIYKRFSAACNHFFQKRKKSFKKLWHESEANLAAKKAIVAKAEALKESSDWNETTNVIAALRAEWKAIGSLPHKNTEALWKQFVAACDYFHSRRGKAHAAVQLRVAAENANLEAKRALIKKINALESATNDDETITKLNGYIAEWKKIGFVPYNEKDKVYKEYIDATDKLFEKLKVGDRDRRVGQYRSNITEMADSSSGGKNNRLFGEREKLMRTYERIKSELLTYENNMGFLNISSKGAAKDLFKEMDRKIAALKDEMETIVKKIEAIDENLE